MSTCAKCNSPLPPDAPQGVCPACLLEAGLNPPSDRESLIGARIDKFEVLGELGRGGFGVVYEARDEELQRTVALKVISSEALNHPDAVDRFFNEARAAAQLRHPTIVSVHDVGIHEDNPYLVMELVEGQTLDEIIKRDPIPAERAARYVRDVAEAIHYAHSRRILHRDLKPANVLIDESDRPRVTDFGLARELGAESSLTGSGQALGTPGYMSPEQAEPNGAAAATTTDVYSLGALLYALVTARPPFQAATPLATLKQVIHEDVVPPRELNHEIPADVNTICLKCLQKEPVLRYESAEALAADLNRFLTNRPILARPVGWVGRLGRWGKRNSGLARTLLALLVVSVVSFAALTWLWRRSLDALEAESIARVDLQSANSDLETVNADLVAANSDLEVSQSELMAMTARAQQNERAALEAFEATRRRSYLDSIKLAYQAWTQSELRRMKGLLDEWVPVEGEPDERGWEWYFLDSLGHRSLHIEGFPSTHHVVEWSSDGSRVYWSSLEPQLFFEDADPTGGEQVIYDVSSRRELLRVRNQDQLQLDGRFQRMATRDESGFIAVVDIETGELVVDTQVAAARAEWSPDDNHLACVGSGPDGRQVTIVSAETGETLCTLAEEWDEFPELFTTFVDPDDASPPTLLSMHWQPESGQICCLSLRKRSLEATISDLESGRTLFSTKMPSETLAVCRWSPNGRFLVTVDDSEQTVLWRLTVPVDAVVLESPFSDEPIRIEDSSGIYEFAPGMPLGGLPFGIVDRNGPLVSWSPDSSRVALGEMPAKVAIWNVEDGSIGCTFDAHLGLMDVMEWSPDGSLLATGAQEGQAHIWNADSGERLQTIDIDNSWVRTLDWGPSGEWLAVGGKDIRNGPNDVLIWSVARETELARFRGSESGISAVSCSSDDRRVATSTYDGTLWISDVVFGQEQFVWRTGFATEFSPEGTHLAASNADGEVVVLDWIEKRQTSTLRAKVDRMGNLVWGIGGRLLATTTETVAGEFVDNRVVNIALFDVNTGQQLARIPLGPQTWPDSMELSSGGKYVVYRLRRDSRVVAWDLAEEKVAWESETAEVFQCAPGDERVVVTDADGSRIDLVSLADGRVLRSLETSRAAVRELNWSPDGRLLGAVNADGSLIVWNTADGTAVYEGNAIPGLTTRLAWSTDSRLVACIEDQPGLNPYQPVVESAVALRLIDLETGDTLITAHPHARGITSVAFHPDGRRLATSGRDYSVKILDVASGAELIAFDTGTDVMGQLMWSPDGVSLSASGIEFSDSLMIWDARPSRNISHFRPQPQGAEP